MGRFSAVDPAVRMALIPLSQEWSMFLKKHIHSSKIPSFAYRKIIAIKTLKTICYFIIIEVICQ